MWFLRTPPNSSLQKKITAKFKIPHNLKELEWKNCFELCGQQDFLTVVSDTHWRKIAQHAADPNATNSTTSCVWVSHQGSLWRRHITAQRARMSTTQTTTITTMPTRLQSRLSTTNWGPLGRYWISLFPSWQSFLFRLSGKWLLYNNSVFHGFKTSFPWF